MAHPIEKIWDQFPLHRIGSNRAYFAGLQADKDGSISLRKVAPKLSLKDDMTVPKAAVLVQLDRAIARKQNRKGIE